MHVLESVEEHRAIDFREELLVDVDGRDPENVHVEQGLTSRPQHGPRRFENAAIGGGRPLPFWI